MSQIDHAAIAASFTGGKPLAFAVRPDGSLVVIAHTGQKFKFTKEEVETKAEELKPKPKPKAVPEAQKPASKPPVKK
jgi:hypothetical protein